MYYLVKHWDVYRKRIGNLVNHVTLYNIEFVVAVLIEEDMYDGA